MDEVDRGRVSRWVAGDGGGDGESGVGGVNHDARMSFFLDLTIFTHLHPTPSTHTHIHKSNTLDRHHSQ